MGCWFHTRRGKWRRPQAATSPTLQVILCTESHKEFPKIYYNFFNLTKLNPVLLKDIWSMYKNQVLFLYTCNEQSENKIRKTISLTIAWKIKYLGKIKTYKRHTKCIFWIPLSIWGVNNGTLTEWKKKKKSTFYYLSGRQKT